MHKRTCFTAAALVASVILIGCATQPVRNRVTNQGKREIPFTLTSQNNIVVSAVLNDTDALNLMLHTATSDVRLTEAAVQKLQSIKINGSAKVGSWGGSADSRYSKGNQLRIGPWRQSNITVWEDKNSGQGTDGKFGLDFFEKQIVEITFEHHRLAVHDHLPAKVKTYDRLKLENRDGELFAQGSCLIEGKTFTTKFLLHSGYAGGVLLDDVFAASAGVDGKITITEESALQDSFGHTIKVKRGILPGFVLGSAKLANIPVGFFSGGAGAQKMSVIGGEVLKRFNLIFDIANNDLYLKPVRPLKDVS